jgi:hypothetical protein
VAAVSSTERPSTTFELLDIPAPAAAAALSHPNNQPEAPGSPPCASLPVWDRLDPSSAKLSMSPAAARGEQSRAEPVLSAQLG